MYNVLPYNISELIQKPVVHDDPLHWNWTLRQKIEAYTYLLYDVARQVTQIDMEARANQEFDDRCEIDRLQNGGTQRESG